MMEELPNGWVTTELHAIAEVRLGRQRSPDRAVGDHLRPYMRAANVTWDGISTDDVKEMDFTPNEFATYSLRMGDILLSEASGSATEVGKPAIWQDQIPGACFQNTLIRVRASGELVPYLYWHFRHDALSGRFAEASKGIGIHHLGREMLAKWRVHLPPLAEQRRIVAKIEELTARSRSAQEALAELPTLLEQFRQSVLASAFRGDLTADWRTKHPDAEPASVLLDRIRNERRKQWETKYPKKKYVEPEPVDGTDLPELPEGWCWAKWSEVGFCQNGTAFPSTSYASEGVKLLRPGNLHVGGSLTWTEENTRYLPEKVAE